MDIKRFFFIMIILPLLLTSCASPLKQKFISEKEPKFEGPVSPITIPIQFEYKPARSNWKYETIIQIGKNTAESRMSGNFNISALGDLLVWNITVLKLKIGTKTTAHNLPIIDARMLTDKFGVTREFEMSLPSVKNSKLSDKERQKIRAGFKKNVKQLMSDFPTSPIQSGDVIRNLLDKEDLKKLISPFLVLPATIQDAVDVLRAEEEAAATGDAPPPSPPRAVAEAIVTVGIKEINLILKGWCYHENRKTILASVDEWRSEENQELMVNAKFVGYVLYDPTTFQTVKGELLITVNAFDSSTNKWEKIKGLMHFVNNLDR
ncbi:hypothetical protein ACFL2S_11830 [Thermodesulfobacteriota bacterium]